MNFKKPTDPVMVKKKRGTSLNASRPSTICRTYGAGGTGKDANNLLDTDLKDLTDFLSLTPVRCIAPTGQAEATEGTELNLFPKYSGRIDPS
ncbi:hypothetical protein LCGC14_2760200 [marine sediment metagenome]|uniref:Uncharacterized protein n=1 Tax=marine sediment metagenome TaxID=412755 RepID=A0A0F9BQQ6_9ZZZZ